MILSGESIRLAEIVTPFEERQKFRGMSFGVSCCGYDVRADVRLLLREYPVLRQSLTPDGKGVIVAPGKGLRIPVVEGFTMPKTVVGTVWGKSTWNRQGLLVAGAVYEPGWHGQPNVTVHNVSEEDIVVVHGEPIAQVLFQNVDRPVSYDGKYQGQGGMQGPIRE